VRHSPDAVAELLALLSLADAEKETLTAEKERLRAENEQLKAKLARRRF
jgi:cell division septum initiation protein DivIVA